MPDSNVMDLDILRLFKHRSNYVKWSRFVSDGLSHEAHTLLKDIGVYFEAFPNDSKIDINKFSTWFHQYRHPDMRKEHRTIYSHIIKKLHTDCEELADILIESYRKKEVFYDIAEMANKGLGIESIQNRIDVYKSENLEIADDGVVKKSLDELLQSTDKEEGFKWRLDELNTHLGHLCKGEFGIIAARPNSGKTSFLASELTHMAEQLKEGQTILWCNNEGMEEKICVRLYSAMFDKRRDQIAQDMQYYNEEYKKKGGGSILVCDIKGKGHKDVEILTNKYNPSVIVLDMIDNMRGFEQGNTSLERLRDLYQWALEHSAKHCPVLGTTQLNRNAEGCSYPSMADLEGSGTAKQAAASFILMIGKKDEPGYDNSRFLSAPKNKYGSGRLDAEVMFDAERCRYRSPIGG